MAEALRIIGAGRGKTWILKGRDKHPRGVIASRNNFKKSNKFLV
jgi:hypothetical protein